MDTIGAVETILVAAATVAASGTAPQTVKDGYATLKALLANEYKVASISILEVEPNNSAYRAALHQELRTKPAIADDGEVLKLALHVQKA